MLFSLIQLAAVDTDKLINVTLTGLLIVFSVLILLTIIFRIFGAVADGLAKAASKPKPVKSSKQEELPGLFEEEVTPEPQPETDNRLIAVIAAAIAAYEPGRRYAIRSVRRAQNASPASDAWSAAGVYENTRPF